MKHQFVPTANYRRFIEAIKRVESRGAREACMLLVSGAPGRGKSNITEGWAAQTGAIFLRANKGWSPNDFLRALAGELRIDDSGTGRDLFKRILARLAAMGFPRIVLDEVQHCIPDSAAVLEKVRDFSDRTHSVVVLVAGEEGVLNRIKRYPQIASRIAENVDFELATVEDVTVICGQLSEVSIAADLISRIHKDSKGVLRLVMNAITAVEDMARTNGLKAVSAKQFADSGAPLCVDWQVGSPRRSA